MGALFACLSRFSCLVVAVSGGPDSLALLHLIAQWRRRDAAAAPELWAATVDHRLRPTSGEEAEFVARAAAALEVRHVILPWDGDKPATGLPEAAREVRYRLLEAFARGLETAGPKAVVTAHHGDDLAETLLMRLARGSGLDGLAAMTPERRLSPAGDVMLVRPLLNIAKGRLTATLRAAGVNWIDDPTNERLDLERGRVRKMMNVLAAEGLTAKVLARSAQRLDAARAAVSYADAAFTATLGLATHNGIFAALDRAAFALGPRLLQERVLSRLLDQFGGTTPRPELSEVEDLVRRVGAEGRIVATLGGAMLSASPRSLRIWREPARIRDEALPLTPGVPAVWDRRFEVSVAGGASGAIEVRALGQAGYASLAQALAPEIDLPHGAAYGLPAFWEGEKLRAVPSLAGYISCRSGTPSKEASGADRFEVRAIWT